MASPDNQSFRYRSVTPSGAVVTGSLDAPNRAIAATRLQEQGHVPLQIEAIRPKAGLSRLLMMEIKWRPRPGARLVADVIGRLALLLDAGVVLETSLGLLAGSESAPQLKEQATRLLERLRDGASLAEAMVIDDKLFPPMVIAMVRAGEASGSLGPTLGRLSDYLARAEAVKQSVQSALIYPAILVITAVACILLVLLVILPQLEPVFADSGAKLPVLTQIAFAASGALREHWGVLLVLLLLLAGLVAHFRRNAVLRLKIDRWLLDAPLIGAVVRRAEAGRFCRILSAMVAGGVALPNALVLAQPVLANRAITTAVKAVTVAVREGRGLAQELSRTNLFPELAIQMIRIGEATGRLDTMLLRLADILEADVRRALDRALALLVPSLTIVLGGMVAGIIASVMMAMLSINDLVR